MTMSLNSRYDFKQGFFTCDLPVDVVEIILRVKTKCGKHTQKDDREKRTEKYRPLERWTDDIPRCRLDSLFPSVTYNSGPWLPTPEFDYKLKLFNDPRSTHSDKEIMPPSEPAPMPVLNIEESDVLERTERLLENNNKWEPHMAQQVPLLRSSSPYPDNNETIPLEQVEPETEDNMDVRGFSERPTNDKRPPKSSQKPRVMLQNLIPPPGCPDYMAINAAVVGIPKPQHIEIRGMTPEKKKVARGWPTCLKRLPLKAMFHNNDIYAKHTNDSEHHYQEPKDKVMQEEHGPKEKNMRVFYKLNVKDNIDITTTPDEEEYDDQNY